MNLTKIHHKSHNCIEGQNLRDMTLFKLKTSIFGIKLLEFEILKK